ncbi:MAG: hypothetical protein GY810_29835 [Aureispira sp.]|nr:hypothetical protein [Aureispira sp.]
MLKYTFLLFLCLSTTLKAQVLSDSFQLNLAYHWAPIHVQDVKQNPKDGLGGRADYITAIDFDGDWKMNNNWDNAANDQYDFSGKCYYSVSQTQSHWFIIYSFFHPRDWSDKFLIKKWDTHENDLEGLLVVIKRPEIHSSNSFGELQAVLTVFHLNFYTFLPAKSSLKANKSKVHGKITMWPHPNHKGMHIVTAQEYGGHGLKAYPYVKPKGDDYVVYYPSLKKENPVPNGYIHQKAYYSLVNIFEEDGLWEHRKDSLTFAPNGGFYGLYGQKFSAKPPWKWNDFNDAFPDGGELATDPVKIVGSYLKGFKNLSEIYELNLYTPF